MSADWRSKPRGPKFQELFPALPKYAAPGRHGAYLVRDAAGGVLYVGRTNDLRRRFAKGHRYVAPWFKGVSAVEFFPCDGPAESRVLEKALIAAFRPKANRNDVLIPEPRGRQLPTDPAARLVALHEAVTDAPLHRREAEDEALDAYMATLHREGWTLASIGDALHMTRQGVSKRLCKRRRDQGNASAAA